MVRYVVLVLLFSACTLGRLDDRGCTTIKRGSFPLLTTPDSGQWSIVDTRQIENYCQRDEFVYIGSYKEYHLLFWPSEDQRYAGVEHSFAVLKGTYGPVHPFEYKGRTKTSPDGTVEKAFR